MPRKKLIYTHLYPYHITARSNNKEWFYIPIEECWEIFASHLNKIGERFGFVTHGFVLMHNHYHLLGTASEKFDVGTTMCWFQTSVSRTISRRAGRINHLFGGPYKPSLIDDPGYYFHVYKYLYRNPVAANLCARVEDYPYSTLPWRKRIPPGEVIRIAPPQTGIDHFIATEKSETLEWLNSGYDGEEAERIRKGLTRTRFSIKDNSRRKFFRLSTSI